MNNTNFLDKKVKRKGDSEVKNADVKKETDWSLSSITSRGVTEDSSNFRAWSID